LIHFKQLKTQTLNTFILDKIGRVIHCQYPGKTIQKTDVRGIVLADVLTPEYKKSVLKIMTKVLKDKQSRPIEYTFCLHGEIRHKVGFVYPYKKNHLRLVVQRIAGPQDRRQIDRRQIAKNKNITIFPQAKKKQRLTLPIGNSTYMQKKHKVV